MELDNKVGEKFEEATAEPPYSGNPAGFENVKNSIADKLHDFSEAIGDKAAGRDAPSGISEYSQQASKWLDQSAEYVRKFDIEQAEASAREYVGRSPGRSLLIAGGVGLIIGAILRRR